jgi:hypothetical protein
VTRIWRLIRDAANDAADTANGAVLRWCLQWHRPLDVSYDNDGTEVICPRCKTEWPCAEFQRLTELRDGIAARR